MERDQVTAKQKKEEGGWLTDRQNERDRIYQNGRATQPVEVEERL